MSISVQPSATTTPPPAMGLMTEEEFLERHGAESNIELVDGVVVRYPMPGFRHGVAANNFAVDLTVYVRTLKLGRVCNNDTFVRIQADPIRIRGADVAYLSYAQFPADAKFPEGPMPATPELVAEAKSPTDTWLSVFRKVLEYLDAGVQVVVVLDPATETATTYRANTLQETFRADTELTIPDLFPGFSVRVASLFQ